MKKKKKRFSYIELQIIEESLKRNISPVEIAKSIDRDLQTLRNKIYKMGWKSNHSIERKKLKSERKKAIKGKVNACQKEQNLVKNNIRMSIHPYLGDKWEEILIATGTRLINWKGQRILVMDGMPTTVHVIREKYAKIISEKVPQAASAAESRDQAIHQNSKKAAQIQYNH